MISVPYTILIISLRMNQFVLSEWLTAIWTSVALCVIFSLPYVLLSVFNRFCFGKIVCVLTDSGIHYKDGFLPWSVIQKIEYEIEIQGRNRLDTSRFCHAVIYTEKKTVTLIHAPLHLLSDVRKINPHIKTRLSKNSKWFLTFLFVVTLLITTLIPLFA